MDIPVQLIYPIPSQPALTPLEIEQAADKCIQMLCVKLAEAESARDELSAHAIRLVKALDHIDADLNLPSTMRLGDYLDLVVRSNRERDEALAALRQALVANHNDTGVSL